MAKTVTVTEILAATATPTGDEVTTVTPLSATIVEPYAAPTPSFVALNCPDISDTNQLVTVRKSTYTFALRCGQDFGGVDGVTSDIIAITAYSIQDCAKACASINDNNKGANQCKAVAFSSALAYNQRVNIGNCWLKNSTANTNNNANVTMQLGATLTSVS